MSLLRGALAYCSSQTPPPESDPQVLALADRLRLAARNSDLSAPEVFDTSSYPGVNLVASYFDNPEPLSRQELLYEERCQRSDVLLAEAFCCFDILHVWLERSVRVPKSCRQRLYAIRDDAREESPSLTQSRESKSSKEEPSLCSSSSQRGGESDFPMDRPLCETSSYLSPLTAYPLPDESSSWNRADSAPIDRLVERSFSESPREPLSSILRRENPERMNREAPSFETRNSSSVSKSDEKPIRAPRRNQPGATYGHRERSVWRTFLQGFQSLILTALVFCFLLWVIPIIRQHFTKPESDSDAVVAEESQEGNDESLSPGAVDESTVQKTDTPIAENERLALRPRKNTGSSLQIAFPNQSEKE